MAEKKKPGRRKTARVRFVKETTYGAPLPHLEMNYLIENRIEPMLHNQPITSMSVAKLVASFRFTCPCCGKGIEGEIVGRL
jgi:hypothetical protein